MTDQDNQIVRMETWIKTLVLLSLYGLFRELRPSGPFLTQYLIEPKWVNITEEQVMFITQVYHFI